MQLLNVALRGRDCASEPHSRELVTRAQITAVPRVRGPEPLIEDKQSEIVSGGRLRRRQLRRGQDELRPFGSIPARGLQSLERKSLNHNGEMMVSRNWNRPGRRGLTAHLTIAPV